MGKNIEISVNLLKESIIPTVCFHSRNSSVTVSLGKAYSPLHSDFLFDLAKYRAKKDEFQSKEKSSVQSNDIAQVLVKTVSNHLFIKGFEKTFEKLNEQLEDCIQKQYTQNESKSLKERAVMRQVVMNESFQTILEYVNNFSYLFQSESVISWLNVLEMVEMVKEKVSKEKILEFVKQKLKEHINLPLKSHLYLICVDGISEKGSIPQNRHTMQIKKRLFEEINKEMLKEEKIEIDSTLEKLIKKYSKLESERFKLIKERGKTFSLRQLVVD